MFPYWEAGYQLTCFSVFQFNTHHKLTGTSSTDSTRSDDSYPGRKNYSPLVSCEFIFVSTKIINSAYFVSFAQNLLKLQMPIFIVFYTVACYNLDLKL